MSTTEQLVAAPARQITYSARRADLRLTKRQRYPIRGASGQVEGMTPGEFIGFRNGRFSAPTEGTVQLVDNLDGGRAEVEASELHRWLQNHRLFGDAYEGFVRVEESAPPVSSDEMNALMEVATALDLEKLEELIAQEEAGWAREDLLTVARGAAERITAERARIEEAARAAEAEAAQPAPAAPKTAPKPQAKG